MAPTRYHRSLVALHWVLALLIIMMLVFGTFLTGATPNSDPEKLNHLRGHMTIGTLILVLMVLRVVVRRCTPVPPEVSSNSAALNRLAKAVHVALYVLVFVMLASGIGMAVLADLPAVVFQGVGTLPVDFSHLPPRAVHGLAATLLAALVALHIAAALYHHFIKKDGLLSRMGWGKR